MQLCVSCGSQKRRACFLLGCVSSKRRYWVVRVRHRGGLGLKSGIFRQNMFKIAVCKAVLALCGKAMGQILKKLDIFLKNYLNIVDDLQKTVIKSTH